MRAVKRSRIGVAVSFGGTKIGVALLDAHTGLIIARSARILWCLHPDWDAQQPLGSLIAIVVNVIAILIESIGASISNVAYIGIAWPGPGKYREGLLQATFIPGLEHETNVHRIMMDALADRFGRSIDHVIIAFGLDAHARALGELSLPCGAFAREHSASNGVVVNIATGVAGAIVVAGRLMRSWTPLGSTYGQWGRFVFRNLSSGEWIWRPTADGSIPSIRPGEVRLTELCGGPALRARFSDLNGYPRRPRERNLVHERLCLRRITQEAYRQNTQSLAFIRSVGSELGGAIECVLNAFRLPLQSTNVVLTGGIGEFFGAPPKETSGEDILLAAIKDIGLPCRVVRSRAGLDAEFAGAALFCDPAASEDQISFPCLERNTLRSL